MAREAEDVLLSPRLSDTEVQSYETVKEKFGSHFIPHVNIIFERAKFNQRVHEPNESAEAFITDLHKLADSCDYETLRQDLIRDRIVVGLRDSKLSGRMQFDSKLSLESPVTAARTSESVTKQQDELCTHDMTGLQLEVRRGHCTSMRKATDRYRDHQRSPRGPVDGAVAANDILSESAQLPGSDAMHARS